MGLRFNNIGQTVRIRLIVYIAALLSICTAGCGIYSFSGASTVGLKTLSVQYFVNRAVLVQPALSQYLTNSLIDKCKAQTSLSIVNGIGDANFEGEINEYYTKPITVSADARAASNRFTITIKVKYTNSADPELSFEQTFSRYQDYDSNLNLESVEKELSDKIVVLLIEDIFNKAFVNW